MYYHPSICFPLQIIRSQHTLSTPSTPLLSLFLKHRSCSFASCFCCLYFLIPHPSVCESFAFVRFFFHSFSLSFFFLSICLRHLLALLLPSALALPPLPSPPPPPPPHPYLNFPPPLWLL
ncbi:hypothetical protein K435DRAFT_317437 [Dendrothele bispora CBS 962.96]|uniref:Uncharacterized protein n=1 Tax=Dendrothele bispora (strain CBS 962.96) TaxID=1314807 RepID=A0A4S8LH81_DENBC|nr:hypothetical protein K435DRAFT_317437 [Dendrothele bispora CBS 962.96]